MSLRSTNCATKQPSLKSEAKVASSTSRHPAHQPHQVRNHINTRRPSKSTTQAKSSCASTRGGQRPNQQTSTNDVLTIQVHCQTQATEAVHQQAKGSPTQPGADYTKAKCNKRSKYKLYINKRRCQQV